MGTATIVVDRAVAARLGDGLPGGLLASPGRPRRLRARRGDGHCDALIGLMCDLPAPRMVLAWPPGDPDLARVGRALGADVLTLPADAAAAEWVAHVAGALAQVAAPALLRVMEVLAAGPGVAGELPTRAWGRDARLQVPALRPATLARWASRTWAPCHWCPRGGAPGHRCRRCASAIHLAQVAA